MKIRVTRNPSGTFKRNVFINMAGRLVPMVTGIAISPIFINTVGLKVYGILVLLWSVLGYFGFADLGLGRALTQYISRVSQYSMRDAATGFWTATIFNLLFTMTAVLLTFVVLETISVKSFHSFTSFVPWLLIAIPLTTLSSIFTGSLAGLQRWSVVNIFESGGTILLQGMPLLLVIFGLRDPTVLFATSIGAKMVGTLGLFFAAWSSTGGTRPSFSVSVAKQLLSYGGWVTLTSIAGPILTTIDRFVIGAVLGAASVPLYTIPYSIATQIFFFPSSLTATLFPKIAGEEASDTLRSSLLLWISMIMPLTVFMLIAIHPTLRFWINPIFAAKATPIVQVLLFGAVINSIAFFPYTLLQAKGRPDQVAKFHLIELIPYFVVLAIGIKTAGLIGVAWASVFRITIDTVLLFWGSRKLEHWNIRIIVFLGLMVCFTVSTISLTSGLIHITMIVMDSVIALKWAQMVSPYKFNFRRFWFKFRH